MNTHDHLVPVTRVTRDWIHKFASGFGGKGRLIDSMLEFGHRDGIAPNPAFRPDLQMHVALYRDFQRTLTPRQIGQMLDASIAEYVRRLAHRSPYNPPALEVWSVNHDPGLPRAWQYEAISEGVVPAEHIVTRWREALDHLLLVLPPVTAENGKVVEVEIYTDRALRQLYGEVERRAIRLSLDTVTLLDRKLVELAKARGSYPEPEKRTP